jgi:hypothetical protein
MRRLGVDPAHASHQEARLQTEATVDLDLTGLNRGARLRARRGKPASHDLRIQPAALVSLIRVGQFFAPIRRHADVLSP